MTEIKSFWITISFGHLKKKKKCLTITSINVLYCILWVESEILTLKLKNVFDINKLYHGLMQDRLLLSVVYLRFGKYYYLSIRY